MPHGQGHALLREVEHVKDNGFEAAVLTMVNGVHHLHNSLALMHNLFLAFFADDGQLALISWQ